MRIFSEKEYEKHIKVVTQYARWKHGKKDLMQGVKDWRKTRTIGI